MSMAQPWPLCLELLGLLASCESLRASRHGLPAASAPYPRHASGLTYRHPGPLAGSAWAPVAGPAPGLGALQRSAVVPARARRLVRNSAATSLWGAAAAWALRLLRGDAGPQEALLDDGTESWEDLKKRLWEQQTPEERNFRKKLSDGCGPPNALASIRVFGQDVNVAENIVFYRDSASWCPFCHKVWMLLEEKQIPYTVKRVEMDCYGGNKPKEFLEIQPSGTIPAAVIDGIPVQSSEAIIDVLLSRPGHSRAVDEELDARDDPRADKLIRLSNTLFATWLGWLGMFGMRRPKNEFEAVLGYVEDALSKDGTGAYFLGDRFSVVDIMFVPYLERAAASLAYATGVDVRDGASYPAIHAWFSAMESRPSYRASKCDYYTHAHNVPESYGSFPLTRGGERARAQIDGESWRLPLGRDGLEPAWDWIPLHHARREAAERIIANPVRVARFAARAAGVPGFPPVAADLADPNAVPAARWVPSIDVLLRHVTALLLTGDTGAERAAMLASVAKTAALLSIADRGVAADCMEYLQRRIGVPRDMSQPAAANLRAELGEVIAVLRP